ncbi:uncharacterized protein CCOS01_10279 [Colletotrichum costaricense]|uniref:Uncharacterized protein n=1 Tax=Colletotrichum costaricense TaxID=1209916 RepID=A0AAI9YT25_9PEZI|nr:uncharacterized protein CCOS01_10279 [Colletotrichum costaricense]KAK1522567.1 hypothetical protein CCOS01_10279 [Colletotrichum costaricense]
MRSIPIPAVMTTPSSQNLFSIRSFACGEKLPQLWGDRSKTSKV